LKLKRHILSELKAWKNSDERKPLLLRGARQVGKTTLVVEFSETFTHRILLNLEKPNDRYFFENYDSAKSLIEALLLSKNIPFEKLNDTLLFIDEIQESPKAIQLLRYFHEDLPQLKVIAAGSLLEFAMHKVKSMPVGRVEYLYMYPLNFSEFLKAIKHQLADEELDKVPLNPHAHNTLLELFNRYAIIGGMPEAVASYIKHNNVASLPKIYESVWETYKEDVEKYSSNEKERRIIRHVMDTAPLYLDQRVKFQNFGNSNYQSREVGEALRNLDMAKVIQLIVPTTDTEIPVKPDMKKAPRMQFLDTGIVNHVLGIQADMLALDDLSDTFKGAIIPHLVTQELISLNSRIVRKPNFWVREKNQASAEVDLVFPYKNLLIPIEIKSGKIGKLKSLHQFVQRTNHPYAVRVYAGEYKIERQTSPEGVDYLLMHLPYFLGTKIPEYISYFVENYSLETFQNEYVKVKE
jgi:predicted AAA+ superfamily ATPase